MTEKQPPRLESPIIGVPLPYVPKRPIPQHHDWVKAIEDRAIQTRAKEDAPHGLEALIAETHGLTVQDYARTLTERIVTPVGGRRNIAATVGLYTESLLGEKAGSEAEEAVLGESALLTVGHLGSFQWPIHYQSALQRSLATQRKVIVSLAGGQVPLDNDSCARGGFPYARDRIIGYLRNPDGSLQMDTDKQPLPVRSSLRVNVFPQRLHKVLSLAAPPFTKEWIRSAMSEVERLARRKEIGIKERDASIQYFEEICLRDDVLRCELFSDQTVLINYYLWNLLTKNTNLPSLVNLELERVIEAPLVRALRDPSSLISRLFFDPDLLDTFLKKADGVFGCWTKEKLDTVTDPYASDEKRRSALTGAGTNGCWGVGNDGKAFPLKIVRFGKRTYLANPYKKFAIHFEPKELEGAILARKIVPSLPTDFTILLGAGLDCLGGPNQTHYLPEYLRCLVESFEETGYLGLADIIRQVPTTSYSSVQLLVARYGGNVYQSAGAIETLAGGGLTKQQIEAMKKLNFPWAARGGFPLSSGESKLVMLKAAAEAGGLTEEEMRSLIIDLD